jgi:haloalkane dehalogenase
MSGANPYAQLRFRDVKGGRMAYIDEGEGEAIVSPMTRDDFDENLRGAFEGFRTSEGERMVLEQKVFVEAMLPATIQRKLTTAEMDHYREPFRNAGGDRRAMLSWPRSIPIDGEPADVVAVVNEYAKWLSECAVPKLFINGEPGAIVRGRFRDFVRTWPNQTEITVGGVHFLQEDSPREIGTAIAEFVRGLRG